MAFSRSPNRQTPVEAEDYDLTTPEEIARRRRRKRTAAILAALVLLGAGGFFGGRPAYRAVRDWQARRAAAEAQRDMDAGQWDLAVGKVQDALMLSRVEPEVMRTAAVFLTRTGHAREALGFWRQVEKKRTLTDADQRDYAADLLATDDPDAAAAKLRAVWPAGKEGTPADWRLGLQLALRRRQSGEAVALSERLVKAPGSSDQQRIDAAQVLVAASAEDMQKTGWDTVRSLAQGRTAVSLEALLLLARQQASPAAGTEQKGQAAPDRVAAAELLAGRIENHPLAKTAQKLLALDLRLAVAPGRHDELVKTAIERFGHGDDETLASLAGWLYAQGEFQRVLEVITPQKATASRALYLQYLDDLGALGRWQDIKNAIEGQKFSLDPALEQMYLARCLGQLGQVEGSTLRWNSAVQAAGANVDKLLMVGRYAQRNGVLGPAEAAFRAAIKAAPDSRPAQEGLLNLLQEEGRTAAARDVLAGMLAVWPNDPAVRNDAAYLGVLLGQDLTANRDVARELVRAEPGNLPHRVTLALAELRLGHALTALDAFGKAPLAVIATQGRYLAVYVAVLRAVGSYDAEIKEAMQALDPARLLPEERELVKE